MRPTADTFDQLDSAILRGISVGGLLIWETLTIDNPDETDLDKVQFTCDWVLVEQSLTPIPADTRAGVDRSLAAVLERDGAIFDTIIEPRAGITTQSRPRRFVKRLLETLMDGNTTNPSH